MHHIHGPGISLRKKRTVKKQPPKISAPIAQQQPQQQQQQPPLPQASAARPTIPQIAEAARPIYPSPSGSQTSLQIPGGGGGGGGQKTADYVKRRVSMRVANLPKDFASGGAPTLPSIPSDFLSQPPARSAGRGPSGVQSGKPVLELAALADPHLQVDRYVAQLLANASEQDIRDYQADLAFHEKDNAKALQGNILQNRGHFINISRAAEDLRGEMRVLRGLMSELTTNLAQTNGALGINTETVSARKYSNRSSVANLEAMWSQHLQELWRRVEGSQKFLPAIPGRHVLHESGRWVELDNATFKPRRRVHLILLNDHLLIAVEKRRTDISPNVDPGRGKPTAPTTLAADRCLPLHEVEINDLGSSNPAPPPANRRASRLPTSNAINVRIGQESHTYAANDTDGSEKMTFLTRVRKAISDVRKALLVDVDDPSATTNGKRLSWNGNGNGLNGVNGAGSKAGNAAAAHGNMLVDADGRQQSYRWVEGQVDELDIDIALQRFSTAVERVEYMRRIAKSNRNNAVVQALVEGRVAEQAQKLAGAIMRQMGEHSANKTKMQEAVTMLKGLGFEARASTRFLEVRSEMMRKRTRYVLISSFAATSYPREDLPLENITTDNTKANAPTRAISNPTSSSYPISTSTSSATQSSSTKRASTNPLNLPSSNGPKSMSTTSTACSRARRAVSTARPTTGAPCWPWRGRTRRCLRRWASTSDTWLGGAWAPRSNGLIISFSLE